MIEHFSLFRLETSRISSYFVHRWTLNSKNAMGKSKKKAMHSLKEEQQARKVMIVIGIVAIVLVIAMFVGYSYRG